MVSDDYSEARVYVREMTRGNHFAANSGVSGFPDGVARMRLSRAASNGKTEEDVENERSSKQIFEAEKNLRTGHPRAALEILEGIDCKDDPYGRTLMIQAAERSEQWDKLAVAIGEPNTASERIKLVEALTQVGRTDDALAELEAPGGPRMAEHVRREIRQRLMCLVAIRESGI